MSRIEIVIVLVDLRHKPTDLMLLLCTHSIRRRVPNAVTRRDQTFYVNTMIATAENSVQICYQAA
jgi:hypothetical protein